MSTTVRIGTSGYSFPDWVGVVYPGRTRPADMLRTYAQDFDVVEINFTYYRDPTPDIFAGMQRHVSGDFEFVVKAPRGLTHDRDKMPSVADSFLAALAPLVETGQLGAVLIQFPQSFHVSPAAWDHLRRVADLFLPAGIPAHVEFRHREWTHESVYRALRETGLGFVNVDLPRIGSLPAPTSVRTNDVAYYRLHGRNAAMWYNPPTGSHRYDYLYTEAELEEWAQRIEGAMGGASKTYVFLNNCHKGSSFVNALRLRQRLEQAAGTASEGDGTLFADSDPKLRISELTRRVEAARAVERDEATSRTRLPRQT